ncbi:MAG: ABC transporter permease [Gammaproteobacteria bacterium]|nr:ABC transporter permease [Gammaproteobacteria bacterium]NIR84317.1 ABC transporter permease [Gammaproteobacteria bacterium]NIR89832.1 ABC transporter permease [Gammaproteobacteria bacterium]NIU05699.1 ABC transporter permease [Gammaproteobacteria bacterium]NIV52459.1 ABC transporter permease subunit [Gammaproteobacteria bacterium]
MRLYAALIYLFLYGPIALVVIFSFNAGEHAASFVCCGTSWYGHALNNPFLVEALKNSLFIGGVSAVLSCIMGTMAALALQRVKGVLRVIYDGVIYVAIMIPGIVIGIATLIAFVTAFDFINPLLAEMWPGKAEASPHLSLGYGAVIGAHTMWTMALVIVIVRARIQGMDRTLIEASADLYATPWRTFRQVTLPQIFPAVLAGFLLSFTFSFDEFIMAFFVAGSDTTLPIYIYSSIRRGITPETNAIATIVLAVSLALLITAQLLLRRHDRRTTSGGAS